MDGGAPKSTKTCTGIGQRQKNEARQQASRVFGEVRWLRAAHCSVVREPQKVPELLPVPVKSAVIRDKSAVQKLPERADLNVFQMVPLA